jgi:hypothetical protein
MPLHTQYPLQYLNYTTPRWYFSSVDPLISCSSPISVALSLRIRKGPVTYCTGSIHPPPPLSLSHPKYSTYQLVPDPNLPAHGQPILFPSTTVPYPRDTRSSYGSRHGCQDTARLRYWNVSRRVGRVGT